jgi:hypothetical protein
MTPGMMYVPAALFSEQIKKPAFSKVVAANRPLIDGARRFPGLPEAENLKILQQTGIINFIFNFA